MGLADKVQDKSERRRDIGTDAAHVKNKRATDAALLMLCAKFFDKSDNSQSTMALGIFEKGLQKIVLIALQRGAKPNHAAIAELKSQPAYADYEVKTILPEFVPPAPGLHAEMMIVRALMLTPKMLRPGDLAKSAAQINLRIVCPEKKVCPDCAGYLRKHGIPHYPIDCGNPSPNWVNPRTGACFRTAGDHVGYWNKPGRTPFGNPVDSRAGNLGPLERVGR